MAASAPSSPGRGTCQLRLQLVRGDVARTHVAVTASSRNHRASSARIAGLRSHSDAGPEHMPIVTLKKSTTCRISYAVRGPVPSALSSYKTLNQPRPVASSAV